jgi:hypothetical protein
MYTSERLNSSIPSPSLHLLGSDAGFKAQLPLILSTPSDDGKREQHYYYQTRPAVPALPTNRDKHLPDIPPHLQALAKLEGSSIPPPFFASNLSNTKSKPKIQIKPTTGNAVIGVNGNGNSNGARVYPKSPVEQVRKVFNNNTNTARKLLVSKLISLT